MKPYSIELRDQIVKIYEQGDTSIRKVATRFDVSKGFVQKLLKQKRTTGRVQPQQQGGSLKNVLKSRTNESIQRVEKYPDSTLSEPKWILAFDYNEAVSPSMMWIELQKQNLTQKKRPYAVVSLPLKKCKLSGVNIRKKRQILTLTTSFFSMKWAFYWGWHEPVHVQYVVVESTI